MSPNPKLALDLETGPLSVAVISPDPLLAQELRRAVRVRRDIVVIEQASGADVLVWDTGPSGDSSPIALDGVATLALAADAASARRALAAGAVGVIPRAVDTSGLIAAVIATRFGFSVRSAELEERASDVEGEVELTERESQVLELLASGAGNRAIGRGLDISEHTVKFHIASLLNKLQAQTRTQAVVSGLRRGLIHL